MPITQKHLDQAVELAKRRGATRVVLFGSATESLEEARDLDLAVAGVPGWDFFRLAAEMERKLRVPLDVIPLDGGGSDSDGSSGSDDSGASENGFDRRSAFLRRIGQRGRVLYQA